MAVENKWQQNGKTIMNLIWVVSAVVLGLVIVLFNLPKAKEVPGFVPYLPKLNAVLNFTCSVLLITSYYFIRKKKVNIHKRLNIIAFFLSSLFLLSYVLFHAFGVETKFPADNPLRPVYLVILLTHIVLAATVLPMILFSFYFGLSGQIKRHRKLTRWSFPVWLYVTVTGVVVYLMISPYYSF